MAERADGSIVVDVDLDAEGFKAGSTELQSAVKSFSAQAEKLGPAFQRAMSGNMSSIAAFNGKAQLLESTMANIKKEMLACADTMAPTAESEALASAAEKAEQAQAKLQKSIEATEEKLEKAKASAQDYYDEVARAQASTEEMLKNSDTTEQVNRVLEIEKLELEQIEKKYTSQLGKVKELTAGLEEQKQKHAELTQQAQEFKAQVEQAMNPFSKTEWYGQIAQNLKQASSELANMKEQARQAGEKLSDGPIRAAKSTKQASASMGDLSQKSKEASGHVNKTATAGRKLASYLRSALSHVGRMVSGLARMTFHSRDTSRGMQGLLTSIKRLTPALLAAEGIMGLLRKAVNAYMQENQQMANTLNACWSSIGNMLGPIIERLVSLVALAAAYFTRFLQLLGFVGKSTGKAISTAGNAAAGEAKKLERQLASFDELNILSGHGTNSGGGGSGVGDLNGALPEVELPDWAKLIVEQLKAGDWAAAATTLADQLNSMIASVDWAGIGRKIGYHLNGVLTFLATFIKQFDWKALSSDLATMLNNIITSVDWGNLGVLLAAKWAILLQLLDGFFETFDGKAFSDGLYDLIMGAINACDWVGLTGNLSRNISNFITSINFGKLASALSTGIRIALQSINAAITNFDWAGVGGKIADFINGIDWSGIFSDLVTLISNLFIGALNLLNGFASKVDWKGLADEIWRCLESLVTDIDWDNFGTLLGEGINGAIIGLLDFIGSLFGEHDWSVIIQDLSSGLSEALKAAVENIDWAGVIESFSIAVTNIIPQLPSIFLGIFAVPHDLLAAFFEGIGLDSVAGFFRGVADAMRTAGTWLKENLVDPIVNWVKNLFGIHSPSTVFAEIGGFLITGLLQGVSTPWHSIVAFFTGGAEGLKSLLGNAWTSIKTNTSNVWSNIKTTLSSTWSNIKTTASTTWSNLKSTVSEKWSGIKANTSSTWSSIKFSLSNTWNGIKSKASSTFSGIKNTIQNQGWYGVGSNICSGIRNGIDAGWTWLSNTVGNLASNLLGAAKSALGIHSPSVLFKRIIGLNIGYGIGEGIKDSQPAILNSVSGVADSIAEEFNAQEYALGPISVDEKSGLPRALDGFSDTIADSFSSLLDRLETIAQRVTFTVPAVAGTVVPYQVASAAAGGDNKAAETIEASNEELGSVVIQVVSQAAAAIVRAIEENSGKSGPLDKSLLAKAVKEEFDRNTKMRGKPALLI